MADKNGTPPNPPTPFDQFKKLAGKLVQVPKSEADSKESDYRRKRARKKALRKRKPA